MILETSSKSISRHSPFLCAAYMLLRSTRKNFFRIRIPLIVPASTGSGSTTLVRCVRCTCGSRSELDVKGRVHLDDVCELANPAESGGAGTLHHLAERVAAAEQQQTRTY